MAHIYYVSKKFCLIFRIYTSIYIYMLHICHQKIHTVRFSKHKTGYDAVLIDKFLKYPNISIIITFFYIKGCL